MSTTIHPSQAPCVCGHLKGDHHVSAARGLRPVHAGVCFVDGCDCREYKVAGAEERLATALAGISWVRGMCTDGASLVEIDAKLGEVLRDAA